MVTVLVGFFFVHQFDDALKSAFILMSSSSSSESYVEFISFRAYLYVSE